MGYGVKTGLLVSLRVPYEVKDQRIDYRTLDGDPFEPPYGDIHHRTERLDGFGDGELGAAVSPARDFLVGAGITLPFGRTEEDPIDLGRRGLKHEHIQFGSGTVDPTLAVQWSRPFGPLTLAASANARIPLYENRHGFRAPVTLRWSIGPKVVVAGAGVSVHYTGQYQSIGKWSGEADEGTGFHNGGVSLRSSFLLAPGWRLTPGVYREVYSESLSDESFRQGTTWSIVLTRFVSN